MIKPNRQFDLEKISLPFKYFTGPLVAVIGLVISMYLYIYHNDIQWAKGNFTELKEGQKEIITELHRETEEEMNYRERVDSKLMALRGACCSEEYNGRSGNQPHLN